VSSTVIDIENLSKSYFLGHVEVPALMDIDLTVEEGDFVAIMGPSGSGKSTLMHILGCLDRPTRGRYVLGGRRVESLDDNALSRLRNKEIGFVFQTFNLLPQMDVRANVELPLIYSGVPVAQRRRQAREQIESVGLSDRARHLPNELSGGQRQRVAVARALVNNPSILLADEPTGNLDTKTGDGILKMFEEINAQGKTIVLVTHEMEIAERARRIVRTRDGRIQEIVETASAAKTSGVG
jgi:putative ABC transport system ATP-binding protein